MTENKNEDKCTNLNIERLFSDAKDDECKAIEKKYKVEIRGLMNNLRNAKLMVSNIEREIDDLKLKITNELEAL